MEKVRFLTVFRRTRSLLVILVLLTPVIIAVPQAVGAQQDKIDRQEIARQIAGNWIRVGIKQYERGFYRQAEQSLFRARDYEKYLTADQRSTLTILLEKSRTAATERKQILDSIQAADKLIKDGQFMQARSGLEELGASEFLTKAERLGVNARIEQIDSQTKEQRQQFAELFNLSEKLYKDQQFEKAREGFVKVAANSLLVATEAKEAQRYITEIDNISARQEVVFEPVRPRAEEIISRTPAPEEQFSRQIEAKPLWQRERERVKKSRELPLIDVAGPITDEEGGIADVNRKINILRSYTKAIVSDTAVKTQSLINQGRYDKARDVVNAARGMVNENRLPLGEDLFMRHIGQLERLTDNIIRARGEETEQVRERQRLAAIAKEAQRQYTQAQRQYKKQIEAERKEKITRMMNSATAYLQQGRYKETAEQLNQAIELIKKITWEQSTE